MKKLFLLSLALGFLSNGLYAQSTFSEVYAVIQNKCATCHSAAAPAGSLVLEYANEADLHSALYFGDVQNAEANTRGEKLIYPGRVDKSFLFKKMNQGLDGDLSLVGDDGTSMPPYGSPQLDVKEKELIRQWINYGAKQTGDIDPLDLIADYYDNNGIASFPTGAPPAPDPSEGFQVKVGPFFIEPGGEQELFQKYELELPVDLEVTRIETMMSNYSHHYLLYRYTNNNTAGSISHGLRPLQAHNNITLVEAVQESFDMQLPEGTAFAWPANSVLDLNTHYINYSPTQTYMAEAYINVYTQAAGTADQEMYTELLLNYDFYLPADGNEYTFEDPIIESWLGDIHLWGLTGHTHKYGTDFKAYKRTQVGEKGEMIYDGACPNGEPGCAAPYYDYQHIPTRFFDDLLTINMSLGMIQEASYVNTGTTPVAFGLTSDDEMMILIAMFTLDPLTTSVEKPVSANPMEQAVVYPNPMETVSYVLLPEAQEEVSLTLYDMLGKELRRVEGNNTNQLSIEKGDLAKGMYIYRIEDGNQNFSTGKIIIH